MCNRYRLGCGKILGVSLIAAGAIILLSSLPCWMWLSVVGIAMILIGVAILRSER